MRLRVGPQGFLEVIVRSNSVNCHELSILCPTAC